jgi:hypothetical protein
MNACVPAWVFRPDKRNNYVGRLRKCISRRAQDLHELEGGDRGLKFDVKWPYGLEHGSHNLLPLGNLLFRLRAFHLDGKAMADAWKDPHSGLTESHAGFNRRQGIVRLTHLVRYHNGGQPIGEDVEVLIRDIGPGEQGQKRLLCQTK